jgi:hypothetical protein
MFPENEVQIYEFKMNGTDFRVQCREGNHTIYTSNDHYGMTEIDESHLDYWIGVVYSYEMSDNQGGNSYTSADYTAMAYACRLLKVCPDFRDMERMIGYVSIYGAAPLGIDKILQNARSWKSLQDCKEMNPLTEGAD